MGNRRLRPRPLAGVFPKFKPGVPPTRAPREARPKLKLSYKVAAEGSQAQKQGGCFALLRNPIPGNSSRNSTVLPENRGPRQISGLQTLPLWASEAEAGTSR